MKFIADENVDSIIVERLRNDAHAVMYVIEMQPGIPDERCFNERTMMTQCSSRRTRISGN
jgi:hypothetical protein